jgi:RNA polymerase sigma factor (sigma-70 family)
MQGLRAVQIQKTAEEEPLALIDGRHPLTRFHVIAVDAPSEHSRPNVDEFNALVARLKPGIKGIVHKLQTRSPIMDGDDLTQTTLVHLWTLYGHGETQDKTLSYLLQGCYHHLRNQLRLRRHTSGETSLDEDPSHPEFGPGEEHPILDTHTLEDKWQGDMLLRSVYESGLTGQEESVLSQLLDGMTVREIGAHLGVSHVRVVKLTKSIRSKFTEYLKGRDQAEVTKETRSLLVGVQTQRRGFKHQLAPAGSKRTNRELKRQRSSSV